MLAWLGFNGLILVAETAQLGPKPDALKISDECSGASVQLSH